ncbi:MAG: C25 family cysteine peptidase [bacterium]
MALLPVLICLISNLTFGQTSNDIQHLIIYTKDYKTEAETLQKYRTANGIPSMAKCAEDIFSEASADPTYCSGYESECYLKTTDTIDGVNSGAYEGLFGLGTKTDDKIQDYAGLIRAYIRKIKATNPLKYVVLMGDPNKIPPRFTQQKKSAPMYKYIGTRDITIPTDFYYSEVFLKWKPNDRSNYMHLYKPKGDEEFVKYPFARVFNTPPGNQAPNCVNSMSDLPSIPPGDNTIASYITIPESSFPQLMAVGRITAKPAHGDMSIGAYITRLKKWEKNTISTPIVVVTSNDASEDGRLKEDAIALLKASDYAKDIRFIYPEKEDMSSNVKTINETGFSVMWPEGHGCPESICVKYCSKSPSVAQFVYPTSFVNTSGKANGFVISTACEIIGYVGTNHDAYNDYKDKKTLGEKVLSTSTVGVYGNYLAGTKGDDFTNIALLNSIYKLSKNNKKATIGDALLEVYKGILTQTPLPGTKNYPTEYQLLNRVYLGDPAAKIQEGK